MAAKAGLHLDPWEAHVLEVALRENQLGKWSAFEVGLIVSRQNGKGAILEARELAGLFLFGERLIIHSAHEFKTAKVAFGRIKQLIQGTPDFLSRVRQFRFSNEEVSVELHNGQKLLFVARSGGSGRGFTADVIILDEAFNLGEESMAALLPTLSAVPNPQIWYTSSAGDVGQKGHNPEVLARVRRRGVAGDDKNLAFFEWSANQDAKGHMTDDPADPMTWARANPALGIRINADHIIREMASLDADTFEVERLGVGRWPQDQFGRGPISPDRWADVADAESSAVDPIVFAAAVSLDRSHAAIGVAGRRADGLMHVEVIEHHKGTGWLVDRMVELRDQHKPAAIVMDPGSPAGMLIADMEAKGLAIENLTGREVAQAHGAFVAGVNEDPSTIRHRPHPALTDAIAQATARPLGDAEAWDGRNLADVSTLVAVTNAAYGHTVHAPKSYDLLNSFW